MIARKQTSGGTRVVTITDDQADEYREAGYTIDGDKPARGRKQAATKADDESAD